ncbi:MAG: hypothetical protein QOJ34_615, partial [Pseudonocardiales bacterium]|nr:hypothetical protein [Pseudonocardiales bacterium]
MDEFLVGVEEAPEPDDGVELPGVVEDVEGFGRPVAVGPGLEPPE